MLITIQPFEIEDEPLDLPAQASHFDIGRSARFNLALVRRGCLFGDIDRQLEWIDEVSNRTAIHDSCRSLKCNI
jgi:hypothetical protein